MKTRWTNGWHEVPIYQTKLIEVDGDLEQVDRQYGTLEYLIEDGCFKRGVRTVNGTQKTVYPYLEDKNGGYDLATDLRACKRNYDRLYWL